MNSDSASMNGAENPVVIYVWEADGHLELSVDFKEGFDPEEPNAAQAAGMVMLNHLMDYVEEVESISES